MMLPPATSQADVLVRGIRIAQVVAKCRLDHAHLADRAVANQLDQLVRLRVAAVHERFHQEHAGRAHGLDHPLRLCGIDRERLFAKHMLAGPRRLERPL